MKYEVYGVVDGKGQIVFASDDESEYKAFVASLPTEPPDYLDDDHMYSPSAPWEAPGMRVSDFL